MDDFLGTLRVLALSAKGVQCANAAACASAPPFWLPRNGHVTWSAAPRPGALVEASIPAWLAAKHRQLEGLISDQNRLRVEYARPIEPKEAAMAIEQKDMTGVLFRIDEDKRKNEKWPEFDGHVIVNNRKYYLSAWVKTSEKSGRKFFSLSLKPADEKNGATATAKKVTDADVPF
jgi:hypothetical protein